MKTLAVVLDKPEQLRVAPVALREPGKTDIVVETDWTGISTGTEKLLYTGRMPPFPGLEYPLVPGYECTGRVIAAGAETGLAEGQRVFVPGSHSFTEVRGLFGGSAARLVADASKVVPVNATLAKTQCFWRLQPRRIMPLPHRRMARRNWWSGMAFLAASLPVSLSRLALKRRWFGKRPKPVAPVRKAMRWSRRTNDATQGYERVCDASGADDIVDTLVGKLARGGEIVLAGFYESRISFAFPPAFMREARLRIAAEWSPQDMSAVLALADAGKLSLDGLIS
jgi:3-hydroxyethyl bacteriochlorophyllide a dehydrogenase